MHLVTLDQNMSSTEPSTEDVIDMCVQLIATDSQSIEAIQAKELEHREAHGKGGGTILNLCHRMLVRACHADPRAFNSHWSTIKDRDIECVNEEARKRLATTIVALADISESMLTA